MKRVKIYLALLALLLSLALTSLRTASASGPTLSITDSETGSSTITFPEGTQLGTMFTVNVTLTDTPFLAAWQLNITYDPTLLNITSTNHLILPADNVFGADADIVSNYLYEGSLFFAVGIKIGGPDYVNVTTGTLCQINFTIIKNDTDLPLNCNLHFVTESENPMYTMLIDPSANEISVTFVDAGYTIIPEFSNALIMVSLLSTSAIVILLFQRKAWFRRRVH